MGAPEEEYVVARRVVFPAALWRVLCSVAEDQGVEPVSLAVTAMQAGLGSVTAQVSADPKPLVKLLDELPGQDNDAWLDGL